jgi:hypothetical protein
MIRRLADGSLTALAVRADDWPNIEREYQRQRNGEGNEPRDWIEAILRHDPPFPWADGPTVARCYRTSEAAERAGLVLRGHRGIRHFPLVIEQGVFQLLCPVLPVLSSRAATTVVSDEMLAVLELLGLGDEARRLNPSSRWERVRERARSSREHVQLPADIQMRFGDPWRLAE